MWKSWTCCAHLQASTREVEAEDQEFKVNLDSIVDLRPAWATYMKTCLKVGGVDFNLLRTSLLNQNSYLLKTTTKYTTVKRVSRAHYVHPQESSS